MKKNIFYLVFLIGLFVFSSFSYGEDVTPREMVKKIQWLGQAAVRINADGKIIYIDPYQIKNQDKADLILITHSHSDHLSIEDIAKLAGENTIFVVPRECVESLRDVNREKLYIMEPMQRITVKNILIEAVPAYNIVKDYHPKENQRLGYILTVNGVRIYHTGDTERIPGMKNLRCDIIMLPLGQTYTMNSVEEAADCVLDVQAKIAIPIHYGLYEGTEEDAKKFKKILNKENKKIEVIIKNPG